MGFRAIAKPLSIAACFKVAELLGIPAYSYATGSEESQPLAKHFHPSRYRLPPKVRYLCPFAGMSGQLQPLEAGEAGEDWVEWGLRPANVDFPVRFIVYGGMGALASELLPALFAHIGI